MSNENINSGFDIPLSQLEDTIKQNINGELNGYDRIIPLRELRNPRHMSFMYVPVFEAIIRNIPLRRKDEVIKPYENSQIKVFGVEPKGLDIGQTFVLEQKVISIMQVLDKEVFTQFVTKGLSKMPPVFLYGEDKEGKKAIAIYMPPIVEIHGGHPVLIDGIHRSYICHSAGTTVNAVHISDISQKLPFNPMDWSKTKLSKEKPPKNERYLNLDMSYFRDLNSIGIDG